MAVVSNNADYDFGDQISFFGVLQRKNTLTGISGGGSSSGGGSYYEW